MTGITDDATRHTDGERHPLTLGFRDHQVEQQYQGELASRAFPQVRLATIASAVLWLIGGVIYAGQGVVRPGLAYGVTGAMVVANLLALQLMRRFRRHDQLQIIVVGFTTSAAVAALWLAAAGGHLVEYGALAVMLIAVFAFVVLQLRFVYAAVVGVVYLGLFVGFSVGAGSPQATTVVQTFLMASALFPAVLGVWALESSGRDRFLQRRRISSLHQQVERLLRRYLSPSVAEVMIADPSTSDLGGRMAEVTILFADLQGFTPHSLRHTPEQVTEMLNRYFEVVVPTVLDEGGSVLSFAGDAVLAVFNAPDPCPDHALRACRAALRIQAATAELAREPGPGEAPPFRIGINTGSVLVGNVGSAEMRTFTVVGDAVNLSSRLQTHADSGLVLIGPATHRAVRGEVEATAIDPVVLKGMSEPIQPYVLHRMTTP